MKNPDQSAITDKVESAGFVCVGCGDCCSEVEPGSNLVMVTRREVRVIMQYTGQTFEEIAEPYPDRITFGDQIYTFGWALIRKGCHCRFLEGNRCMIYPVRPWICRTYPFMIDNGVLLISPCQGLNQAAKTESSQKIVLDLVTRKREEIKEDEKIEEIMKSAKIPLGKPVVIDSEGVFEIDG